MPQIRPLRPGDPERVAGWRLVGVLGSGGQGTVYKAVGDDGREVAVKLLHSHLIGDDGITRGFLREVEAARRVAAFCTAAVLDVGTADERPYIVSEYVAGDTLQQVVRSEGPRTGGALDRLAISTLTALAAIHQAGIVHRDFKPGNVLIGPEGPIVIDFGIAKALDATTMASGVVGTPTYMSPEQFEGQRVGPASDMFSWAGTMVFAATGRPAYAGATVPAILNAVLSGSPDLDGVPERLAEVLRPCFARDPALRPSPTELMKRLMTHRGPAVPFPPPTPTPSGPGAVPVPGTTGPDEAPSGHAAGPAAAGPAAAGPAAPLMDRSASTPAATGPGAPPSGHAALPGTAGPSRMPSDHAYGPSAGPGSPPSGHAAAMPGAAGPAAAGPGGGPAGQGAAALGMGGGGVPVSSPAVPWSGAGGPVGGAGEGIGRPVPEGRGGPGGRREQGTVEGRGSGARGRGFQGPYHGGMPDPETSPGGARKGVSRRAVLSAGAAALATAAVSAFVALRPDGGATRHDGTLDQPPVPDTGTTEMPSTIGSPAPTSAQPSTQTPATPVAAEPFGTLIGEPAALPAGSGTPSAAMGARGPFVALGGSNGSVVAWDLSTGPARRLGDGGAATTALAYGNSRGEPVIASGHADGRMRLWRPSGESLASHKAPDPIIAVTVTAAGRVVAVSQKYDSLRDLRGVVRLWDVTTGKQIGPTSTEHFQGVNGLAFGRLGDADVLVTGDGANRVRVRPLSTGVVSGTFKTGEIGGIERLACGELKGVQVLVSTHLDGSLRVYDLKSGKRRKKWDFSDRSPDDRGTAALVTGALGGMPVAVVAHTPSGGDAFVRVWSLADGEIVGEFGSGEGGGIRTLALAEQAVTRPVVATLGTDRRVRLWSLGTG
ncbi:serine/threonine-protein kinase [Nonomuraea wenchangensis]